MIANLIAALAFAAVAMVMLAPKLRASDLWRATVTPLASIIGSGFLVSLPLLAQAVGSHAVVAIGALTLAAYLLGGAIRFNILHGEALFEKPADYPLVCGLERTSHLTLALAYFISVAYYLSLLAAFLLKGLGIVDPYGQRAITTALLAVLGFYGMWKGLRGLESAEEYAVGLKLAIIGAVLAALLWLNIERVTAGTWSLTAPDPPVTWHSVSVVLGTLIVVQGFETARFLKGAYEPALRVRAMRYAQALSGAIYVAFFALALVLLPAREVQGDVAAVTGILGAAAGVLPLMLVFGAIFAQASAAIADAIGATGLLSELGGRRLRRSRTYPVVAAIGIVLVWLVDIFGVIALASRAFAVFYFVQCLVAAGTARRAPGISYRSLRMAGFFALAAVAGMVAVFGIPAEGE